MQSNQEQSYIQQTPEETRKMSREEFYKHPANKKIRANILIPAVILYVCAALSLVVNVIVAGNLLGIVDSIILLGTALGMHIAQSRIAASIIVAYSIFNTVYMLLTAGVFGGWLITVAAFIGAAAVFRFQKVWNAYQRKKEEPTVQPYV